MSQHYVLGLVRWSQEDCREPPLDGSGYPETLPYIEEENASGPMSQLICRMESIAAETGCSIVFLHHSSKGAVSMGTSDQQQASRGSSVLVDNIRWQSYLASMTPGEAEDWGVEDSQRGFFVRFGISKATTAFLIF